MVKKKLLELLHVKKHYNSPDGKRIIPVLKDINLKVKKGQSIAIVGPSGSGKSTLLNIMGCLDYPSSGKVKLLEKDVSALSEKELSLIRNQYIGFVFQLHHLLPQLTVLENVFIPTIPFSRQKDSLQLESKANKLLERVGLGSHVHHRPGQLSGGECQRVALIRALINQPKLILADEPTGALDREHADSLSDLLVELNKEQGATLIVVTHSLKLARRMDLLLFLKQGYLSAAET